MAFDSYKETADDDEESSGSSNDSPAVTNVRVNERDHPDAYEAMKGGGPIRSFAKDTPFTTKEFVGKFVSAVGDLCDSGNAIPLMEFARLEAGDILRYCDEANIGTVERDEQSGDVTITFNTSDGGESDDTDDSDEE